MFGAGACVLHHLASRDLPQPVLHEQHVLGALAGLGFFWGEFGRCLGFEFGIF